MSKNSELSSKAAKKPALGRGLGSLLGESTRSEVTPPAFAENKEAALKEGFVEKPLSPPVEIAARVPDHARIWNIDVAKLVPHKNQPRQVFQAEALKELTLSIKEKGILQPIVARPRPDGDFEIIAGERRWRAAQAAGLHEVPVILKKSENQEALELALIENIQRENLNPLEEAEAYQHLIETYHLTQQQLADKLGKDRATIANTLRLLGLSQPVRALLSEGKITMGHAKVLLALTDAQEQKKVAEKVVHRRLSVRDLEREIAQLLKPKTDVSEALNVDVAQKFMVGLSEELQKIVGTRVSIDYDKGRGKIAIHFFSDEQLNGIVEKVRNAWHS